MTEHHAISRRAFTLGLGLAALSPLASLPETAMLGISPRAAFADSTAGPAVSLDNFVIRLRPAGYFVPQALTKTATSSATSAICLMTARPASSSLRT